MIAKREEKIGRRRGLSDIVAVDVATSGLKLVRMKRAKEGLTISAVGQIPISELPDVDDSNEEERSRIALPKVFRAKHSALSVTSSRAVIRLLNLPGFSEKSPNAENTVREHVGLEDGFRLGYSVGGPQRGKSEVNLIAVGLPEEDATSTLEMLGGGTPAPISVEVSALSAATGFALSVAPRFSKGAVGLIEGGSRVTCLSIFSQNMPVLLRKFEFGSEDILNRIQRDFGVDRETSENIVGESSFDISASVEGAMKGFIRQLSISREFVERRVGASIQAWFVTGGLALTSDWKQNIYESVGRPVEVWNPFENLFMVPGTVPAELKGQEVRFSAAVGAAMGALEDA
jgi:Tfp pilus assembly PilM family ATPase